VVVRFRKRQQRLDGGSDTKYLAIVSNRSELDPSTLCRWHWQKAGTIEQVHDITKNELAARVRPVVASAPMPLGVGSP
jgi:hypothetical protein